jgi:hypothetical protein
MPCRSFGQPRWRILVSQVADRERIEAYDGIIRDTNVGLGRARLLVLPGVAQKVTIQFFSPTIEALDGVLAP